MADNNPVTRGFADESKVIRVEIKLDERTNNKVRELAKQQGRTRKNFIENLLRNL